VRESLRRAAGLFVVDSALRGLSRLGQLHPRAQPARHGVEVERDVRYLPTGLPAHTLDVWWPRGGGARRPVVVYVHGGGFRILSKDTHWVMALAYARRGYVVFNINYRLAPEHRFPAGLEDASAALLWVKRNAHRWGGDPERLILAGESAGANLVTALAIATAWRRPEPFARAVFDAGVAARAVIPACGILQVSDAGRFARRKPLPAYISDRIEEVATGYLGRKHVTEMCHMADPLLILEQSGPPDRSMPPFFTFVGTRDPILDDTRRLHAALQKLQVPCEIKYFPGELHAFHALVWRPSAVACWRESFRWLERTLSNRLVDEVINL
jgi:acetyl esterase/lipase